MVTDPNDDIDDDNNDSDADDLNVAVIGAIAGPAVAHYVSAALAANVTTVWVFPDFATLWEHRALPTLLVLADDQPDAREVVEAALTFRASVVCDRPFTWNAAAADDLHAQARAAELALRVGLPARRATLDPEHVPAISPLERIEVRRTVVVDGADPGPEALLLDATGVDRLAQALSRTGDPRHGTLVAAPTQRGDGVTLIVRPVEGPPLSIVTRRGDAPHDELALIGVQSIARLRFPTAPAAEDGGGVLTVTTRRGNRRTTTLPDLATARRMVLADALAARADGASASRDSEAPLLAVVAAARRSLARLGARDPSVVI